MDERLLVKKISLGDEQAFRVLFDRYAGRIYAYALQLIKSEQKAEEIVHDVFLKLWQKRTADPIEHIEAYLKTAARNTVLNVLRKQRLDARVIEYARMHAPRMKNDTEEALAYKEVEYSLQQALKAMPAQQKRVYLLCRQKGLPYNEVARILSLSPLTVKTHMQHALRFLRSRFAKQEGH